MYGSRQRPRGKLVVFCGVREYPSRVKCATLAWHTLRTALNDKGSDTGETASTLWNKATGERFAKTSSPP